jgi:serine/threonine protein kinase
MDATSWNRVKDLIADALELPPSERIPFLEARCTEPALLEEALDLLKWYDEAQNFLEKPGELRPANSDSGDDVLEPGTRVGPYVIVGQLGGGGMGRVYLGNDQRLRRKVALKRLFASPFDPSDEYARILQEARAAALVNHPNVATIHDVVEQRPRAFIVMEYVEGETLADWLRREPMPLDRTLAIGRQLASALVAAHASGVVHRDL